MTDAAVRPRTPLVVWALVGAIMLAYGAFAMAPPATQNAIDYAFALIPERFHADSPARFAHWYEAIGALIGHAFLHVEWWHAALNAFFLFLTARLPALRLGAWRFLALFLVSTVSGAATFLALNWDSQVIAIGASGAVCGVFTAYFFSLRATWRDALADPRVRNPLAVLFFVNVVLMGVAAETGLLPIAWEDHLGGFVGGGVAYALLQPRPRGRWG